MDPLEVARWQFGITTVYHFLMVPLTIGLGIVLVAMQTAWHRTGKEQYLRMTKFWGKIFMINFIMGVATGLVQEFQFGMAWSEYSRFVGDVFGAPLAMEALIAFFLESVFIGIWVFGWGRVRPRVHLTVLWLAVAGSVVSAYFILAANAFMQHPVGVEYVDGRAQMVDFWAVMTNPTLLVHFPHTIFGALAVAGSMLLGIGWYHLWKRRKEGIDTVDKHGYVVVGSTGSKARDEVDYKGWRSSFRWGGWIAIVAFLGTAFTGHTQAQMMIQQQPLKMAAAEAACHDGTGFSLLSVASRDGEGATTCNDVVGVFEIPGLLSFLAHNDFTTPVEGVNSLIPQYEEAFGTHLPDDPRYGERAGSEIEYLPIMEVTYWGFRLMITFGGIAAVAAALGLWIGRKGTVPHDKTLMNMAWLSILAPFAANSAGWIFTEMGRQPFTVAPNPDPTGVDQVWQYTAAAVSPGVTGQEIVFSLAALTLIYALLLVVEVVLLVRYTKGGHPAGMPELLADEDTDDDDHKPSSDVLSFAY
ncbi:MAG: cytochrome ubiquinol oxidase subunit I [Yaniella sp.]|uniref:cytochrome ubiquinol oxidase subunit I n=1 Tax=Yaniella sp. TaxID=2773929 RepID=UPI00264A409D|nr:cytochrome ubiquinol oxidase subunit I [Yaniella sp.]MDN5704792.1 cytochrome ubiquinol oxidase subunit I [Yaniella sp.]MDN5730266.1 cytochrome ubiquinol oxidase subunit I [Yaniella sp.]MDN5814256.1 cytochrome ubiquinol oxidase subunit I [Yaniella sp.]MDN5817104.1 cytochrome ubiquinol oxidase subunit I [Yaniella sp.]MDN5888837.1 cytochrome ubiquinol oxidase subunit I [Yaniella sp.]